MTIYSALAIALAAGSLAPAAHAQPEPPPAFEAVERTLIDRTLTQRTVRLISLDARTLQAMDSNGHRLQLPIADLLALVPPLPPLDQPYVPEKMSQTFTNPETQQPVKAQPTQPTGRLDTSDTQLFPGKLGTGKAVKDHLLWDSRLYGEVQVPLDVLSLVVFNTDHPAPAREPGKSSEDAVYLQNGDRVEGFIAAILPDVRIEKGGKPVDIPLARVDALRFANPPKPATGTWAWLADGSVVAASSLTIDDRGSAQVTGRITGLTTQPTASVGANEVVSIAFDAAAVYPLARLEFTVAPTQDSGRVWTPPPHVMGDAVAPLGAPDIELPGPMTVEWTLPRGAMTFTTTVELPPSARLWGECDIIIQTVPGGAIGKEHLSGEYPTAVITGPLSGATKLRVSIDPGPSGPVQDRVILRRALVLTAPVTAPLPAPAPAPPKSPR